MFRKEFIETKSWTVERELIESRINPGNLRQPELRKKLFTSFARFNGAIGIRKENPPCVERGVRELAPSHFYMGFKRTRDDADNHAVDINGNIQKVLKDVLKDVVKGYSKFLKLRTYFLKIQIKMKIKAH